MCRGPWGLGRCRDSVGTGRCSARCRPKGGTCLAGGSEPCPLTGRGLLAPGVRGLTCDHTWPGQELPNLNRF